MSQLRRFIVGLGAVVLALGLVFFVAPADVLPALPFQYVFVSFLGVIAIGQGLWVARSRWHGSTDQALPPDVEARQTASIPGSDVDRMLLELTRLQRGTIEYRERIRERLVDVAVSVLRQREDCSREEALVMLQEGTWTSDREAAGFFTGSSPPAQSLVDRVKNRLEGESAYERRVRRTVDAIARAAEMEALETASDDEQSIRDRVTSALGAAGFGESVTERIRRQQPVWDDDTVRQSFAPPKGSKTRRTRRWRGVAAFGFLAAGFGIIAFRPALLVSGAIGMIYAGYARAATPPSVDDLAVRRMVDENTPSPGDEVTVTVEVHNEGDALIPDLRLVDGIPAPMEAIDGSPRLATALRPGKTVRFQYTVEASRGTFSWPLHVLARDSSGNSERQAAIEDPEFTLTCLLPLRSTQSVPVRGQTSLFSGRVATDVGGAGLEFFSVREHREGDPLKRVDWKRRARTGELATIDFRKEQAATVLLMFDARESSYLSPGPDYPHALDRSVAVAGDVYGVLSDRGDQVGIASFDTIPMWIGPGAGSKQDETVRQTLAFHPALSPVPPTDEKGQSGYVDPFTHIRRQLQSHTQVMLFSPLGDDYAMEVARRLDAAGHLVTVISPDPTTTETVGQRLARVERTARIRRLREGGVRALDWSADEDLTLALERANQRW